jgi:50S ribosomal protein L16 3-hydroxylase
MDFKAAGLDLQGFLSEHWQKRPVLLRQALASYDPSLDENDIAGLACEEMAESRLVTGNSDANNWSLKHGPFREKQLRNLPDQDWTLLVQDVEKHYPPLQDLLAKFNFLPDWRLDDLMVSIAAPGGSVGPHYDQYDVFLLQASGRRRWQIASQFDRDLLPDCELNVLASFRSEMEWILEPGDVLYLPPGIAHHGVALESGMTWSIGLRAPSQADLLLALGEWMAEHHNEGIRYQDSAISTDQSRGEIDRDALQQFRQLLMNLSGDELQFNDFISSFMSRFRLAHQPAPPDSTVNQEQLVAALKNSATILRNPWTRLVWTEQNGVARLFAAGDQYSCDIDLAKRLCATPPDIKPGTDLTQESELILCRLINRGHLVLSK